MRREREGHGDNVSYGNYSGVVHYNIKVKGSGHFLREDQGADAIVRCVDLDPLNNDAYARFRMVAETDGHWRIRVTATHHYLWEYNTDFEVRGIESVTDTYTSFALEPQADWTYRIKVLASNHYLHEDVTTGILAGGNVTDDMGNFILEPLESSLPCEAYQFEAVCPPDRCSWVGDHCGMPRPHVQSAAAVGATCAPALAAALAALSWP